MIYLTITKHYLHTALWVSCVCLLKTWCIRVKAGPVSLHDHHHYLYKEGTKKIKRFTSFSRAFFFLSSSFFFLLSGIRSSSQLSSLLVKKKSKSFRMNTRARTCRHTDKETDAIQVTNGRLHGDLCGWASMPVVRIYTQLLCSLNKGHLVYSTLYKRQLHSTVV